jgi:putative proteasome-type protease
MTYCVGLRLNAGMVFLADSRTNAGVDQIGTFRKLTVFERPGERVMVLLTSGNLGVTQSVRQLLMEQGEGLSVWDAPTMYDAVTRVGEAVRKVYDRDAKHLQDMGIEFNCTLIFGGQIGNERCRLFQVYSAGNFIEAQDENLYFQIGESKYGKPILDRVVEPSTTLDEAAKCALISMDSTLRSNLSVGLPLDLLCYEAGALRVTRFVTIEADNEYFQIIRKTWGQQLRSAFAELPDPTWHAQDAGGKPAAPVRAPMPSGTERIERSKPAAVQAFAQGPKSSDAGGPKA